jgi:uncharacterized protein
MRVDIHCHMGQRRRQCGDEGRFTFEAPGQYAHCDAYFSDVLYRGPFLWLARWYFGLTGKAYASETDFDKAIERILLDHVTGAQSIDRAVVLAFDQYHTDDGKAVGPRRHRWHYGSDLYVSNTYVRQTWRHHPNRILFGASIHPYRRHGNVTALDMLDEVAKAGAVLVKWLPVSQNIDAEDPRAVDFLRRAAELHIPMLIHYGSEAALGTMHSRLTDPAPLLRTLTKLRNEGHLPTVFVAHAASPPLWPITPARTLHTLLYALRGDFAGAPLYTDLAGMALFNKAVWLLKLSRMPEIHHKLLYASDFPVPPIPLAFYRQLGPEYAKIRKLKSWIDQDVAIKSALGFDSGVFTRAGDLLAERILLADKLTGLV